MKGENLFSIGQRKTGVLYDRGWFRTFRTPPELGTEVRGMLQDYVDAGELNKVLIFFMSVCKVEYDYAHFLVGEFLEGEL